MSYMEQQHGERGRLWIADTAGSDTRTQPQQYSANGWVYRTRTAYGRQRCAVVFGLVYICCVLMRAYKKHVTMYRQVPSK